MPGLTIHCKKGIRPVGEFQLLVKRFIIVSILIDLIWRSLAHLLPHQLLQNELINVGTNLTYHVFVLLGLQDLLIVNKTGALAFDTLLFSSGVMALVWPLKKWFVYPFVLFFFVYEIIFRINLTHHVHLLCAMIIVSFTLLLVKKKNFEIVWEALRYYACWIYVSAFIWKIINGVIFQSDAGIAIVKSNLNTYLFLNSDTSYAQFLYYFIRHPILLNIGVYGMYLLEAFFIVGFFTKRFDYWLLSVLVFLHLVFYVFVDALFVESFILILAFLPVVVYQEIARKIPLLNKPPFS